MPDPLVVVEVLSRGTRARDAGAKLVDYFRLPSVRHYLVVRAEDGIVIHHERDETGVIATHIIRDGTVRLDPPRMVLGTLFPAKRPAP